MAARKKPTRKTTSKKARKSPARKKVTRKKVAAKKNKVAKKKKVARKKVAKKKVTKKKAARKKAAKKKASKKKTKKKVKKKASKKKPARKKVAKKKTSKKKASRKRISKKTVTKTKAKKPASKKTKKKTTNKAAAPKAVGRSNKRRNGGIVDVDPLAISNTDTLIHGIAPYRPKKGEEYMSDEQLEHFRNILLAWKQELMKEVDRTVHHMQDEASNFPDPNDRATQESEFGLELRTRDRERKLLKKIAQAITRIDDGSYGFCEETGEEIGLQRLEARPVATLCVEAQERRELAERQFSDREDQYR